MCTYVVGRCSVAWQVCLVCRNFGAVLGMYGMLAASFPGAEEGEKRAPGTHCLHMRLITTEFGGDCVHMCNIHILVMS